MSCTDCLSSCYNNVFAGNLSLVEKGKVEWSAARTTVTALVGVAALALVTAGIFGLVRPDLAYSFNFRGYNFLATPLHCALSQVTGIFLGTVLLISLRATQEEEVRKKASF